MKILVTGVAGFIGAALAKSLLERGDSIVGVDNLNAYYDVNLKKARLSRLTSFSNFEFHKLDLVKKDSLTELFSNSHPQRVIHLAAQAGVRYSLTHPEAYIDSNIVGFLNVLEGCRAFRVEHLVFASSSSVYGANTRLPLSPHDIADHPMSLYGATKRANELMAHSYSHLFEIPTTGLRFFTVYGPWGRPDMAIFMFTRSILAGKPIEVFNHGEHRRDFTYIDDIVEGVIRVADQPAKGNPQWSGMSPDPASSLSPFRVYNIGGSSPVWLNQMIDTLETTLGTKAKRIPVARQPGDVIETCADAKDLESAIGFTPRTPLMEGIRKFVEWYKDYYGQT